MTETHVLSIWWAIVWRAGVGGVAFDALTNLVGRISPGSYFGVSFVLLPPLIIWNIWATSLALRKQYKDFRIALVQTEAPIS